MPLARVHSMWETFAHSSLGGGSVDRCRCGGRSGRMHDVGGGSGVGVGVGAVGFASVRRAYLSGVAKCRTEHPHPEDWSGADRGRVRGRR
jgi:hypothetical protein